MKSLLDNERTFEPDLAAGARSLPANIGLRDRGRFSQEGEECNSVSAVEYRAVMDQMFFFF